MGDIYYFIYAEHGTGKSLHSLLLVVKYFYNNDKQNRVMYEIGLIWLYMHIFPNIFECMQSI